jgi:sortase (surface protein transpeptidase)
MLVTCYPFYFVGSAPLRYIIHASTNCPINLKASGHQSSLKQEGVPEN